MKNRIFLLIIISALFLLPSCKYNGEGTIIIKNIGPLTIMAQIEYAQRVIGPGSEGEFNLTWPGHDDMHVNIITYPTAYKATMGESLSIWISNGETKTFEISYYPPES